MLLVGTLHSFANTYLLNQPIPKSTLEEWEYMSFSEHFETVRPYPVLEKVVLNRLIHKGYSQMTKYRFYYRKVHLSKLMD